MEATETSNRGMDKEDVVYIYNGILLSHKNKQNNAICSHMDGPRDHLCLRERQIPYDITYRWTLIQMNLGNRNRCTDIGNKLIITKRERGWGRDKLSILD